MSLRVQAVVALAELIQQKLNIPKVEVIAAPPSKVTTYPACALLIDRTGYVINDDEIPVDADGNPLVGGAATTDLPASWATFDPSTMIYRIGRYEMHGRIFVATRLPDQRAELEDQVFALFFEDEDAPGRIVMDIGQPKVLGRELPWKWPVAAFLADEDEGSSWTAEFAFDERLWSWLKFDMDVDIIVPRNSPPIQQLILGFDADFTQPVDDDGEVTDLDDGADTETFLVDQDGDISNYTP